MEQGQSSLSKKMDTTQVQVKILESQQENVQRRAVHVEEQLNRGTKLKRSLLKWYYDQIFVL